MGVTRLVFKLKALKAKIKGAFNRLSYCYGDISGIKKMTTTYLLLIGHLLDTIIVASTDKDFYYRPVKV